MAVSLFDAVPRWTVQSFPVYAWTFSVLLVSIAGIVWHLLWKSHWPIRASDSKTNMNGKATASSQRQLKKGPVADVTDAFTLEREMTVPFDVGEVKVTKILVHPIKSCRGTSVLESRYNLEGFENDRKWALVQTDSRAILTAREAPKMVLIEPRIEVDSTSPYGGRLVVSFPEGSDCETFSVPLYPTDDLLEKWPTIDDCTLFGRFVLQGYVCSSVDSTGRSPSEILSHYLDRPVHLLMKGPRRRDCPTTFAFPDLKASAKFQDFYPAHIASEESLEVLRSVINAYANDESPEAHIGGLDRERWSKDKIQMEWFRPNVVIRGSGVPFAEDMWRQILLRPSDATEGSEESRTFTLVSKCVRCLLPNVDPKKGERDAAVPYKVMLKFRTGRDPIKMDRPCFGVNAIVGGEGVIRVGDTFEVKEWADGIGA